MGRRTYLIRIRCIVTIKWFANFGLPMKPRRTFCRACQVLALILRWRGLAVGVDGRGVGNETPPAHTQSYPMTIKCNFEQPRPRVALSYVHHASLPWRTGVHPQLPTPYPLAKSHACE